MSLTQPADIFPLIERTEKDMAKDRGSFRKKLIHKMFHCYISALNICRIGKERIWSARRCLAVIKKLLTFLSIRSGIKIRSLPEYLCQNICVNIGIYIKRTCLQALKSIQIECIKNLLHCFLNKILICLIPPCAPRERHVCVFLFKLKSVKTEVGVRESLTVEARE